jgi:hypothetical protein
VLANLHGGFTGVRGDPTPEPSARTFLTASNSNASGLSVTIYTNNPATGQNASIGTYTVGDMIKVFILINQNCIEKVVLVTPDGSMWLREFGPTSAGTFPYFIEAQYPTGKWTLSVTATTAASTVVDTAAFEVVDKAPYLCVLTCSVKSTSTIEETRFDGKIVNVYVYPVGGVYGWDILVNRIYVGPEIQNRTVSVQALEYIESTSVVPSDRPGYVDPNITLGDQVEVYGLLSNSTGKLSVSLNGSEDYYIKNLRTLCESPRIVLFAREIFQNNLTVLINGTVLPGQNLTISNVEWNWGDGQSSNQTFPATHTYNQPGTFIIMIKALQNNGLSTIDTVSVTITTNTPSEPTNTTPVTWPIIYGLLLTITIASVILASIGIRARSKKKDRRE